MTEAKKRLNSVILTIEGDAAVQINALPLQTHTGTGGVDDVRFQAKSTANDTTIRVSAVGSEPMKLNQAEWTGTYYKAGRRF